MRKTLILLGFALCVGCRNPIEEIHIVPSGLKPGDTIKIIVTASDQTHDFTVAVAGRIYPMFKTGDGFSFQTFIGLDADWKPGSYKAIFEQSGRHRQLGFRTIHISSRDFPSEIIFLPKEKTDLPEAPHHEEAKEKVIAALNTVNPGRYWDDRFKIPAVGRMTTVYGMRRKINRTMAWPYHRGLDIAAPSGTPVTAANAGRVLVAERFPIQGRTVILDHGQGVTTIYMHLSVIDAIPGTMVKQGDRIGSVGSDGFSTGPHLHWGLYVFGDPVDPRRWMDPDW